MDGATAVDLASRVLDHPKYDPEGEQLGSVAARVREDREWEKENSVIEMSDLKGELADLDVDWS